MTTPMNYVDPPDVPEGMTLSQYRCQRSAPTTPRALKRLRRRARARNAARKARSQPKAA
ncbi:MAG: hypothetical protein QOI98_657 [Solirubrobacteraceae bacterium]|nr:hypothetical protein [Solirubrobacteraceae bacterium]